MSRLITNALREIVGDIEVPTDGGEASIASVEAFIEKQTEHEQDTREKPWHERADDYLATFDDTRERLEADIRIWKEEVLSFSDDEFYELIDGWLDRQAAIDERYWKEQVDVMAESRFEWIDRCIAKQERITELERLVREMRPWMSRADVLQFMPDLDERIDELGIEVEA